MKAKKYGTQWHGLCSCHSVCASLWNGHGPGTVLINCYPYLHCTYHLLNRQKQQLVKKGTKVPSFPVMMGTLFKAEGLGGIYRGLSASLLREMTYSSIRFGMYEPIRDKFQKAGPTDSNAYRIVTRIGSGLTAGGIAAALCSPTDLLKATVQKEIHTSASLSRLSFFS